jgi:hypothetical protein
LCGVFTLNEIQAASLGEDICQVSENEILTKVQTSDHGEDIPDPHLREMVRLRAKYLIEILRKHMVSCVSKYSSKPYELIRV